MPPARGESNTALVVDGATVLTGGVFYVGRAGTNNWLVVTNGGFLGVTNSGSYIGQAIEACGNGATVTGPGSTWSNRGWISVGATGSFNRLAIERGGWAICRTGVVGAAAAATGNTALVTGTDSLWSVATRLYVGFGGVSNRLAIGPGGRVTADRGYIGLTNACGNEVVVDGGRWVFTNSLEIGSAGSASRLTITNGGFVEDSYATLAYYGGSSNNEVVVTGAGSVWSNATDLQVGRLGTNNGLLIERGGAVYAETVSLSGNGGSGNRLAVADTGSVLVCAGMLHVFYGSGNTILIATGAVVRSAGGALGFNAGADSNTMTIAGAGARFVSADNYMIGFSSGDNLFQVLDGGYVELTTPSGIGSRGSRNRAVASGAGTMWTNRSDLGLGSSFSNYFDNRLEITNGAAVCVDGHLRIGQWWDRGSNNAVVVYPGSSLIVRSNLWVISGTNELRGGTLRAGNLLMTNAAGRLAFEAGTLSLGAAEVSNGVPLVVGSGAVAAALELGGGTFHFTDGLLVSSNASVTGAGTVGVGAASFTNSGAVAPGASAGLLMVEGDFLQRPSGILRIDLAGREAGVTHDQLACTGGLSLDGLLDVSRQPGFLPTNGDYFVVAVASSLSGCFAATNLPPWFSWDVQYLGGPVVLSVTGVETATNGVPKAWLADHGWTNDFDSAATNDADGDRVATWEEYYAGTDPNDGASFFQCLEISRTVFPIIGNILRWDAVSGRLYAVEALTNSTPPAWAELTNRLEAPVHSWTDAAPAAAASQYRLRAGR